MPNTFWKTTIHVSVFRFTVRRYIRLLDSSGNFCARGVAPPIETPPIILDLIPVSASAVFCAPLRSDRPPAVDTPPEGSRRPHCISSRPTFRAAYFRGSGAVGGRRQRPAPVAVQGQRSGRSRSAVLPQDGARRLRRVRVRRKRNTWPRTPRRRHAAEPAAVNGAGDFPTLARE